MNRNKNDVQLQNPFETVATKDNPIHFVAESEDLKNFRKYIFDCFDNKDSYIPIIGDYGQGKSRLLFHIIQNYRDNPDLIFTLVSIKKTRLTAPAKPGWAKEFVQILLNNVIKNIIETYKDDEDQTKQEVANIAIKIKNELISKKELDKLKNKSIPFINDKIKNTTGAERKEYQDILDDLIHQKENIESQHNLSTKKIIESFMPAFLRDIKILGINHFFIIFDEVEHLYDLLDARKDFISTRDEFAKLKNVHLCIACAIRVWEKMKEEDTEFSSAIKPSDESKIFIPNYRYEDLFKIVNESLYLINQKDCNPFTNYIIRNIALYNVTVRSALIVCHELYNDYIKNKIFLELKEEQEEYLKKLFNNRYHEILVDQNQVNRMIESILSHFENQISEIRGLARIFKEKFKEEKLAFKEFKKDDFIEFIEQIAPNLGEKIFNYLYEEKQNIINIDKKEGFYQFNNEIFRLITNYIGEKVSKFYFEILYANRDTENNYISIEKAENLFREKKDELSINQKFNETLEILVEQGYLTRETEEGTQLKLLKSPPTPIAGDEINKYLKNKSISRNELNEKLLPNLIGYIWEQKYKRNSEKDYYQIEFPTTLNAGLFNKIYTVSLFIQQHEIIDSDHIDLLSKRLKNILQDNQYVIILYPFDNCQFIENKNRLEELRLNRGDYAGLFKLDNHFEKELQEKCKVLIVFPNKQVTILDKVRTINYLTARKEMEIKMDRITEKLQEFDKSLRMDFPKPIQNLREFFEDKFRNELPIKKAFLSDAPGTKKKIKDFSLMIKDLLEKNNITSGSYDKSDFKQLLNYSFCERTHGTDRNPTEIKLKNANMIFEHKSVPIEIIFLIESMDSEYQDATTILKKFFRKFSNQFDFNEAAFSYKGNKKFVTTAKPVLIALSEVFKENILNENDENFKVVGEGLNPKTIEQIGELFIPFLKKLIEYGFTPKEGEWEYNDLIKEISDLEEEVFPEIHTKMKMGESCIYMLEQKGHSHLQKKIITNKKRLEQLYRITYNSLMGIKQILFDLPPASFVNSPYVEIGETVKNLPPEISSILDSVKYEISKQKKTGILNFEIPLDSFDDLFGIRKMGDEITKIEERIKKIQRTMMEEIKKVQNYNQITKKVENLDENLEQLINLLYSLKKPKESIEIFQKLVVQKEDLKNELKNLIEEFDNLSEKLHFTLTNKFQDIPKCMQNCQSLGVPLSSLISSIIQMGNKINQLEILSFSSIDKDKIIEEVIGYIVFYYKIIDLSNQIKKKIVDYINIQVEKYQKSFLKRMDAIIELSKKFKKTISFDKNSKIRYIKEEILTPYYQKIFEGTQDEEIFYLEEKIEEYLSNQISNLNKELYRVLPPEIKKEVNMLHEAFDNHKLISYLYKSAEEDRKKFEKTLKLLKDMEEAGYLWQ